jgi:protein ImuB
MGLCPMIQSCELYACLYAREFPAQALLRLRPELHNKPCVVMQGEAPTQSVCSLNRKAKLLQMTHGMTRIEVDTFSAPVILQRAPKMERIARDILLECAGSFSQLVEDRSEEAAFLCVLDISGTQGLFGPPEMLVRRLLQRVRSAGITACAAVSSNFHAAVLLARGLHPSLSLRCIAPGEEAEALASLPLSVLAISDTHAETFAQWGLHTVGMLAALPETGLIARMGQDGKRIRQMARGELEHLFQPVEPAFQLEERMELDTPVDLLEPLLFGVAVMLEQLILRVQARILALASITITLALDGPGTYARTIRPALPTNEKQIWIKLLHLDLAAHPPQAAILAVTLAAEPGSTSKVQQGLFCPQLPEATRLDVTLARIRAVVGEDCVGRAVLQDTHACEPFLIEPFTVEASETGAIVGARPHTSRRQLRPPEIVSITLRNSQPAMFFHREYRYTVERAYGPWLVSGDWWSATLWGFEQWDLVARSQDGAMLCCCMMRDLMRNQWQMAALYD